MNSTMACFFLRYQGKKYGTRLVMIRQEFTVIMKSIKTTGCHGEELRQKFIRLSLLMEKNYYQLHSLNIPGNLPLIIFFSKNSTKQMILYFILMREYGLKVIIRK